MTTMNNKNAIFLLCREPNQIWIDFLNCIPDSYQCYVVADVEQKNSNLKNLIYIGDKACYQSKFVRNVEVGIFKPNDSRGEYTPTAWDRALYYISRNNTFDNYWLIEDDVFIPSANTLRIIDNKYPVADLLCSDEVERRNPNEPLDDIWRLMVRDSSIRSYVPFDNPYQKKQHIQNMIFRLNEDAKQYKKLTSPSAFLESDFLFPYPWLKAMMCACRISKKFVNTYSTWLSKNEHVTHHEMFFPTLARHENLNIKWCNNLNSIKYRQEVDLLNVSIDRLYHPVKKINLHKELRNRLC